MYRKFVWCYVFVLTLLDISLNTKLTAQGKSHGVTVHESLIEGLAFQEWGKDGGAGGGGGGGGGGQSEAVSLSPASLQFGRAALATPHALTVTLTNTANTTMHLASVAGTTPDFHASFFESKTLAPQANTTFSVVYLGRREGPVSAHLYIHTSLGVHNYPVSAVGVPSEWEVWPLVGVRVPHNATLDPLLTMHNPTDKTIQISEIYSSGSWLGLQLPEGAGGADGAGGAARALWAIPPHATRPLVRLVLAPHHSPQHQHQHQHALTAYLRIKGDMGGAPLVVGVEALAAPAGEYARPLHLRLRTAGTADPPYTVQIEAGNSGAGGVSVAAGAWGARCSAAPHAPPAPPPPPDAPDAGPAHAHAHNGHLDKGTTNGVKSTGVTVSVLQSLLEPHSPPAPVASLTLDYAAMWAAYLSESGAGAGAAAGGAGAAAGGAGAWCGGWVRVGRAAVPYSVRLLPGTLRVHPQILDFITAELEAKTEDDEDDDIEEMEEAAQKDQAGPGEAAWEGEGASASGTEGEKVVSVHNEFPAPVHIAAVTYGPGVLEHFIVNSPAPLVVPGGGRAVAARVRLRAAGATEGPAARARALAAAAGLTTNITLHTNHTDYTLPLRVYTGKLQLEWDWANTSADGSVWLGAVGTSSTRRVRVVVRNPHAAPLCARSLRAALPGAALALAACPPAAPAAPAGPDHPCRCVAARGAAEAWLTVVAPSRAGPVAGWVRARTRHATTRAHVALHAHRGRLAAPHLPLPPAAPYAPAAAPLHLDNTMPLRMRLHRVEHHPTATNTAALTFLPDPEQVEIGMGRTTVGSVVFAPEALCAPDCYTGLDLNSPEGEAWTRRGEEAAEEADAGPGVGAGAGAWLQADAALQRGRHAAYVRHALRPANVSLRLHTTEVLDIPVTGSSSWWWPRLWEADSGSTGASAGLAGVGSSVSLRLTVRNPSSSHALLLQPIISDHRHVTLSGSAESSSSSSSSSSSPCSEEGACVWSRDAFQLAEWRALRGHVAEWRRDGGTCPEDELDPAPAPAPAPARNASRHALPALLLAPAADLEIRITFAPMEPTTLTAYLFLRNNLTILESIQLTGRGAYPSFELGGRRPGSDAPLLFEVKECPEGSGVVRRTVVARNTGPVPVRLREWRLAGEPCQARGFRLHPCAPLTLQPNETRALTLAFSPDYTLARLAARLRVRTPTGAAEFTVRAALPARLLPRCHARAPRPPFEPSLRAAAELVAFAALALVLAAAALDAERELRRARDARAPPAPLAPHAPLDLRARGRRPRRAAPHRPRAPRRRPPAAAGRVRRRRRRGPRRPSAGERRRRRRLHRLRVGPLRLRLLDVVLARGLLDLLAGGRARRARRGGGRGWRRLGTGAPAAAGPRGRLAAGAGLALALGRTGAEGERRAAPGGPVPARRGRRPPAGARPLRLGDGGRAGAAAARRRPRREAPRAQGQGRQAARGARGAGRAHRRHAAAPLARRAAGAARPGGGGGRRGRRGRGRALGRHVELGGGAGPGGGPAGADRLGRAPARGPRAGALPRRAARRQLAVLLQRPAPRGRPRVHVAPALRPPADLHASRERLPRGAERCRQCGRCGRRVQRGQRRQRGQREQRGGRGQRVPAAGLAVEPGPGGARRVGVERRRPGRAGGRRRGARAGRGRGGGGGRGAAPARVPHAAAPRAPLRPVPLARLHLGAGRAARLAPRRPHRRQQLNPSLLTCRPPRHVTSRHVPSVVSKRDPPASSRDSSLMITCVTVFPTRLSVQD